MITELTAIDLWQKAQAETGDAANLFLSPVGDEREKVFAILSKLRSATSAMQSLEVKIRNHGQR